MSEVNSTTEYRDIPGFPSYRVGDDGSVWSCKNKEGWRLLRGTFVSPPKRSSGYMRIYLFRNKKRFQKYVHIVVLEAFVGRCPKGMVACHFPDPNTRNNMLSNLRWDTTTANGRDSVIQGRRPIGSDMWNSKLLENDIPKIRERLANGESLRKIGSSYGVNHTVIRDIKLKRKWTHVA